LRDGAEASPPGDAPPLPCLGSHNCITGSQHRSAFAFETNVRELVQRVGLERAFELTITTPDNCDDIESFQRRWRSLLGNVLKRRFRDGVWVRERQARGAWHVHCVVAMPFAVTSFPWYEVRNGCYKNVPHHLRVLWRYLRMTLPRYGFGRFQLVPIWSTGDRAAGYFAKYVRKSFAQRHPDDRGTRRWNSWGIAKAATCHFAFVRSASRFKIAWLASTLGLSRYEDFKELLGPRWAYYLFPVLDRENWEDSRNAVWVIACLLRDGFWKWARYLSGSIELGACPTLLELLELHPFLSTYITGPWDVAPWVSNGSIGRTS
jgi:hypothetical protein